MVSKDVTMARKADEQAHRPILPTESKKPMLLGKRRHKQPRKIRRDAGSWRNMSRDDDLLRFNAEQTFLRFDSAGEYLAPGYTPAVADPPAEQLADTRAPTKRGWPADARHRAMAVSRLMRKLEKRGHVDLLQPWADQPAWSRVTAAGLHHIGLDWEETLWPDTPEKIEARFRHDSQFKSHNHLINQVRLLLMRGEASAPPGIWKGERDIETVLPPREKGKHRPHKPDGLWYLKEDGSWSITRRGTILDTVEMKAGQIIAIEVECSRKSDRRLEEILPELVESLDFVWYFCLNDTIHRAVVDARATLPNDEQRRRVRVLKMENYLSCL
jgi:hypothetical protein